MQKGGGVMAHKSFIRLLSEWLIRHRLGILIGFMAVTAFFGWKAINLKVETRFEDLLPANHPYIQTHKAYEKQLGAPYKVFLMLQVASGDIYNQDTLRKAQEITKRLDLTPGVNHDKIYSIASRKVKKTRVTADGIITENFMPRIPDPGEEMVNFRQTVQKNGSVYRVWVSPDEKSLLFAASFIPSLVDPRVLFNDIQKLKRDISDEKHRVFITGEPVLAGWVYSYQQETIIIFGLTFAALVLLLFLYFRNLAGVIVPTLSMLIGGIWGLGFAGLCNFNLEPLTLVIPLLISARALAHSVQITERYLECLEQTNDVKAAAVECNHSMLVPGTTGIITDSLGILLIAVAPIPIMQKLAFVCAFWAINIVLNGIVFTPLMLTFFTPPKNLRAIVHPQKSLIHTVLRPVARITYGRPGWIVVSCMVILFMVAGFFSTKVGIGDINPGTPILWPQSEYNTAVNRINSNFPGTEELYVLFEGKEENAVKSHAFLNILDSFQRHMEASPKVSKTLCVENLLPPIQKAIYGGYFKWQVLPTDERSVGQLYFVLAGNSAPGDFDLYFSRDYKTANVIIWFKDHMGETITEAMSRAKSFIEQNKTLLNKNGVTVRLASGTIGVLAAVDESVRNSQLLNFMLVTAATFLFCALAYRSLVAALILMLPLNLANLMTLSFMKFMGIGLNVNTLPVISVGVGVGIDYGIYLLSRLTEEYRSAGIYTLDAVTKAMLSTGKAIFFTAASMVAGVVFWYFLSSMRFQAEMGLMLGVIMFINMVGALIFVPSLVYVLKPKFLKRGLGSF